MKIDRKERFITKAKEKHGDKYDYSKIEYVNAHTKVCIICHKHGEFWIAPNSHLNGSGCPECGRNKKMTTEAFIEKAKQIHGDKYDYSKVEYVNSHTKVRIICPIHGEFWQRPDHHLHGQGCKKCGDLRRSENKKIYQEDWIKAADELHNHKYDYSKINYVNAKTKVCIICPEHGEFWQKPASHMQGNGCPICNESVLEREIITFLKNENIKYEYRCHPEWLGNLELDFYLPEYNVAIECQGLQHFEPIEHFGGIERFVKQIENDKLKMEKCCEQKIKLLYFSNLKKENIITNLNVLKEKIFTNGTDN